MTLRQPNLGEEGTPFKECLRGSDPVRAPMVEPLILQWGVIRDELRREPTVDEYRRRWPTRPDEALAAFNVMFPNEGDPSRISSLLWSRVPMTGIELLRVPIVEEP